jgi:hypothetical protein
MPLVPTIPINATDADTDVIAALADTAKVAIDAVTAPDVSYDPEPNG